MHLDEINNPSNFDIIYYDQNIQDKHILKKTILGIYD